MTITAIITLLACPIITPSYDLYPPLMATEALRLGVKVSAQSFAADAKGRVNVETHIGGEKKSISIPLRCIAQDSDFQKVSQWNYPATSYDFCEGDYCPKFEIKKNGTAFSSHALCVDGNCGPNYKYTARDCPNGKLSGANLCIREYQIFKHQDLFKLKLKNGKSTEQIYFKLDHQLKAVSLFPEA